MANILVKIEEETGEIRVRALTVAQNNLTEVLQDLEQTLSRHSKSPVEWVVTEPRTGNDKETVELTTQPAVVSEERTNTLRTSIGSVEGRLDMISLHGKPQFTIYSTLTDSAITCTFDKEEIFVDAREALGHRVNVSGLVLSNAKGEPLRVQVERLRKLCNSSDITDLDLQGRFPDFTGGLSSEDYIKQSRIKDRIRQ